MAANPGGSTAVTYSETVAGESLKTWGIVGNMAVASRTQAKTHVIVIMVRGFLLSDL